MTIYDHFSAVRQDKYQVDEEELIDLSRVARDAVGIEEGGEIAIGDEAIVELAATMFRAGRSYQATLAPLEEASVVVRLTTNQAGLIIEKLSEW